MKGKKNTSIEVGTVLFSANDNKNNKDFWDDSELIEHWDRTVQQYRKSIDNKQKQKRKTILKKTTAKPVKQTKPIKQTETTPLMNGDDSLSNLIMSWYYAGYYTALYQSQQQQQQEYHQYQQQEVEEVEEEEE
ncbi:hypothetical protein K501DRAFT_285603 [Backusella circina FSU 941]|nr:hypothetical protein K501DRAFT_285603 [Backusella circina FSU 941]